LSGTLVFKPLEAKLTHDTEVLGKMDPYVQVLVGDKKAHGKVCNDGGKHPKWNDSISVQRAFEPICYLEVKDKDTFSKDDIIGVGQIDLNQIAPNKVSAKWYPLFFKQKPAGEVLIEIIFTPDAHHDAHHHDNHHHQHGHNHHHTHPHHAGHF